MTGVSLVILTGWGGHISLGQFGFVGVGAVVVGNLVDDRVDLFLSLLVWRRRRRRRGPGGRPPGAAHQGPVPRRHHALVRRGPRQLVPQRDRAAARSCPTSHAGRSCCGAVRASRTTTTSTCMRLAFLGLSIRWPPSACGGPVGPGGHRRPRTTSGRPPPRRCGAASVKLVGVPAVRRHRRRSPAASTCWAAGDIGPGPVPSPGSPRRVHHRGHRRPGLALPGPSPACCCSSSSRPGRRSTEYLRWSSPASASWSSLWALPGGLGQLLFAIRDRYPRWVANRRDILVPTPGRRPARGRSRQRPRRRRGRPLERGPRWRPGGAGR